MCLQFYTAMIQLNASNLVYCEHTKYIEVDGRFIREIVKKKGIQMQCTGN